MFELLFPVPFLALGILMTFMREKSAAWFCNAGKALWKSSSFDLTNMAVFYQEDRAKGTFRIIGPVFLLSGLLLCWWAYLSFSGPGMFCAMRESRDYLESRYGYAATWKVSSSFANVDQSVDITYRYGEHVGKLHSIWKKDHYSFTEFPITPPRGK